MVCIRGNEVVSQFDKLIDFGDQSRPALYFVERYSLRILMHYRIVALYFAKWFVFVLVTGQYTSAEAQFPSLLDGKLEAVPVLVAL